MFGAELLLKGKSEDLINNFYKAMDEFSQNKDYEKAALLRDRISALRDIQRTQSIAGFNDSRDAIYVSNSKNNAKIGVTSVSQGWVIGHKNFLQSAGFEEQDILSNFITQKYLNDAECPNFIVINQNLYNKALLEEALSTKYSKKISIIIDLEKKIKAFWRYARRIQNMFLEEIVLISIKMKFQKLKQGLNFKEDLNLIESYDVSHHATKNAVAGCVVYSDQGKAKELYRSYNISKPNWEMILDR